MLKDEARDHSLEAGAKDGFLAGAARAARQILQILILGVGAGLAIRQEVSPGAIVASSIILSRALAPIDQIVGSWRSIAQAKSAWARLVESLGTMRDEARRFAPLPRPAAKLAFDRCAIAPPISAKGKELAQPLVRPFSLALDAGRFVCVVGGNGVGKSSLLQTIAGVWPCRSGTISLGERSVHHWPSDDRGQYIGYVPQDVDLLPGTVAENISRMKSGIPADVFDAARAAGAHDMILGLPQAYETPIGARHGEAASHALSAGQRQLIGLSRALYMSPVLLLLDEPTANLDPDTAASVTGALSRAAAEGAIVIAATHDPALIAASDTVLMVKNGALLAAQTTKYLEGARAGKIEAVRPLAQPQRAGEGAVS